MKVGILAGGLGTRLAGHNDKIPKPMVPIGGKPIIWHIMKCYAKYGYNHFVIALGYKSEAELEAVLKPLMQYRNIAETSFWFHF